MPNLEVQNNPFTSILMEEAADPEAIGDADPAVGQRRLIVGDDGLFYMLDSTGTATLVGAGATDATLSTSDITTNNASTSKHGFLKKLSNVATEYMDGTGAWSVPAGGGALVGYSYTNNSTGNYTTSSGSYVDVDATNAKPTLTIGAHRCVIGFSAHFTNPGANTYLSLDAGAVTHEMWGSGGTAVPPTGWITVQVVTAQLSAGSTVFNVRWARDSGTPTLRRSSTGRFSFWVYELPF